jgi:hypothetical protein
MMTSGWAVVREGKIVPRLGECAQRLQGHRDADRLPADALDAIVRTARSGGWESAAEGLYAFMKAQRREGADAPRPMPAKAHARPKGRQPRGTPDGDPYLVVS